MDNSTPFVTGKRERKPKRYLEDEMYEESVAHASRLAKRRAERSGMAFQSPEADFQSGLGTDSNGVASTSAYPNSSYYPKSTPSAQLYADADAAAMQAGPLATQSSRSGEADPYRVHAPGPQSLHNPKRIWTAEEDELLRVAYVRAAGATDSNMRWRDVALHVPNRTPKQCCERWKHHLQPCVRKGDWTEDEDKIIFEQMKIHGRCWTKIARAIPDRTDHAIKNRYYSTCRRIMRKRKRDMFTAESTAISSLAGMTGDLIPSVSKSLSTRSSRSPASSSPKSRTRSASPSVDSDDLAHVLEEPSAGVSRKSSNGSSSSSSTQTLGSTLPSAPFNSHVPRADRYLQNDVDVVQNYAHQLNYPPSAYYYGTNFPYQVTYQSGQPRMPLPYNGHDVSKGEYVNPEYLTPLEYAFEAQQLQFAPNSRGYPLSEKA